MTDCPGPGQRESIPVVLLERQRPRPSAIQRFDDGIVGIQPRPFPRPVRHPVQANAIGLHQKHNSTQGGADFHFSGDVQELVTDGFAAPPAAVEKRADARRGSRFVLAEDRCRWMPQTGATRCGASIIRTSPSTRFCQPRRVLSGRQRTRIAESRDSPSASHCGTADCVHPGYAIPTTVREPHWDRATSNAGSQKLWRRAMNRATSDDTSAESRDRRSSKTAVRAAFPENWTRPGRKCRSTAGSAIRQTPIPLRSRSVRRSAYPVKLKRPVQRVAEEQLIVARAGQMQNVIVVRQPDGIGSGLSPGYGRPILEARRSTNAGSDLPDWPAWPSREPAAETAATLVAVCP